jgi:glycosyltransferase involved in cell wall biosynthesis
MASEQAKGLTVRRFTVDLRMYRHSGIGRYLRNLFPLLLPKLDAGRIRVLGRRATIGEAAWLQDPRIEFIEEPAPIYSITEQAMGLRGAYRTTDLLWVPHYNAPLQYSGRMVVTMHDVAPLAVPGILGNPVKRIYAKLLIERAVKQAAAVLCVSEFTAGELAIRLKAPLSKLTVTHPGLDKEWPESALPHTEAESVPYLLYVGNIKPNKNLGLLLGAFALVMHLLPYRLVLAGKMRGFGTNDEAVIRQAEALGDRVRFTDEVSDTELISLYAGASALVLPSLYEGFGLPLLEAMQLGCPVLCSTAGSLPEVAGDAALYFDPHSEQELADRLCDVGNAVRMQELRQAGFARVRQFSFEECAERSADVMNRLLDRGCK